MPLTMRASLRQHDLLHDPLYNQETVYLCPGEWPRLFGDVINASIARAIGSRYPGLPSSLGRRTHTRTGLCPLLRPLLGHLNEAL